MSTRTIQIEVTDDLANGLLQAIAAYGVRQSARFAGEGARLGVSLFSMRPRYVKPDNVVSLRPVAGPNLPGAA